MVGLSKIGPSTIRTLIIGLFDESELVRQNVELAIEQMSFESIVNIFEDNNSKKLSLKIAMKDILEKNIPINIHIRKLFSELINFFEKEGRQYK